MDITGISQFGFSAYLGSPTPPPGAVPGWSAVSADAGAVLTSVPNASTSRSEQVFTAYFFDLPPNTAGQAMLLQSSATGRYVTAQQASVDGAARTVFAATADTLAEAAQFATYRLGVNLAILWLDPSDGQWYGLTNVTSGTGDGTGLLVASSVSFEAPYLLPWQAAQTNPRWSYTPPGGWNVGNGSDLSFVDFSVLPVAELPFDFSRCRLDHSNLAGKTFGHATFAGCDLSTTTLAPPLGAAADAWIDFTGATVNYGSLGPDWRYLNLTGAVINEFPRPPQKPPQIVARGTVLDHVTMIQWNLAKADFTGASLCNANLSGSYLAGADFHAAVLSPVEETSTAAPANLAYCYLFDADLSDANLQGVSFAYSYLYGGAASLSGASLREADFSNAFLPEIDFSGVYDKDLVGVTFDGACLAGASFAGTSLGRVDTRGFSFVGAALQGTDFTGSNLEGANLTNAAIAAAAPPDGGSALSITSSFHLGSVTVPIEPITYTTATTLAVTDATTFCPSGTGPCDGARLTPSDPAHSPLTSWPVRTGAHPDDPHNQRSTP